jgi:hypothetical protein
VATDSAAQGALDITAKRASLLLLDLPAPVAHVDGRQVPLYWDGNATVPVPVGRHELRVAVPSRHGWIGWTRLVVDVVPGAVVRLNYVYRNPIGAAGPTLTVRPSLNTVNTVRVAVFGVAAVIALVALVVGVLIVL